MPLEVEIETCLPGFNLEVAFATSGRPVGILGASGVGKSMTLRTIAGLEPAARGRIVLDGRVLFDSARGIHLPSRARRVGMVFQHYALFPHLTVQQNVDFGLRSVPQPERARRIAAQIAATHLSGFESRHPASLSGGEQQRVALARALAPQPDALLLDEPFSALDAYLRSELERQLHETLTSYSGAALLVSHNLEEIYRLCGELVVLDKGRVIARGSREDIFQRPPSLRTAELTGCKNFSRAKAVSDYLVEATSWGCTLRVAQKNPRPAGEGGGHLGIRAHHVQVSAGSPASSVPPKENTFPAWLTDVTEGPFRTTLYLRLNTPSVERNDHHLQVEISREHWQELQVYPAPWSVYLDPERILLLSE